MDGAAELAGEKARMRLVVEVDGLLVAEKALLLAVLEDSLLRAKSTASAKLGEAEEEWGLDMRLRAA